MSSYPGAFDSTFPGYPYVDNTEFLDQTHANAWVAAIQAIESTIGYGTAGTAASPLYSATYATTYATVTARIAGLESTVNALPKINASAGTIQPVGAANAAGSSGLLADAAHVHAGQSTAGLKQIGEVFMWAAGPSTFPSNCLQCNGQLVSTSTYNQLFSILGYTHGGIGGSFALPNFNDRFPIGVNSTAPSVGSTGGSTSISINNMPTHSHPASASVNDPTHTHGIGGDTGFRIMVTTPSSYWASTDPLYIGQAISATSLDHSYTGVSVNVSTFNTGGGTTYNQPFLGIYFLIRAA
jgi:microcystin-dependent protein